MSSELVRIAPDVRVGRGAKIHAFANLYGCEIGDETNIGTFVEVQRGATIGSRVKISSHTFICSGVHIEDEVFVGHGVMFTNDKYPRATTAAGQPQAETDWQCIPTVVKHGASIGSNATVLCGVTVGEGAVVGAGSVVTHDVPDRAVAAGVPARVLRFLAADTPPGAIPEHDLPQAMGQNEVAAGDSTMRRGGER